jgi:hypothetical protein
MYIPSSETDGQVYHFGKCGVGRPIEKAERNSWNRSGRKFMFEYEVGVEETMSRAGVDQCQKNEGVGGERNCEGVGSGKSGHVESNLIGHTNGVNTDLSSCGGRRTADYFFESVAGVTLDFSSISFAACPLALVAEEVA